jgi:hypothetical protein
MLKTIVKISFCSVLALNLIACASIVSGTHQNVNVDTGKAKNATCVLENSKGKWYVNQTPGSVTVNKGYGDMNVTCKEKGYKPSALKVASKTSPLVFGNVLLGGGIGAGVDIADGAAYNYPKNINVPMARA